MPSHEVFYRLKSAGINLESDDYARYNLNDTLAGKSDLESLFEILSRYKDSNHNPAVITAMSLVANPDFEKIKDDGYNKYYYEPFTRTLEKYYGTSDVFTLWMEGIRNNIFVPQFHGREHLNVTLWMNMLRTGDRNTLMAFDEKFWGFAPIVMNGLVMENQAAFQLNDISDLENHKQVIIEGLELFEKTFGYRASYFVPPNGPINNSLNEVLKKNGIKFRSTAKIQNEPIGNSKFRKVLHWLGQKDNYGIVYITRNCFLEPAGNSWKDWVDSCLKEVSNAFHWQKPAIISSHRVNYIGSLNTANRATGLKNLNKLLSSIIRKWPEVEFMTTDRLGELMISSKSFPS